ncbi:GTP cyclohydrolase I FolE [Flavobacterium sp. 7A]|uniref:GTP cyclohydrolase I FolE n=1 Tax=Flavobacterium sp. 7A TaxID=2940571 RepID=UPI002225E18F|nr:GTP cyclohydrolase I FolE [Flavobacterium sp. 7A]MCW2119312.1 GTP cyclohydrolase I [Flavobacterium sp. 7A]
MEDLNKQHQEQLGDHHIGTSAETPLRADAFLMPDTQKIEAIAEHYHKIMEILGLDLTDDSLSGTPYRVGKMYVKELFSGLDPKNKPKISVFDNKYQYNKMLVESQITFNSSCEHHFLPIVGVAHIGYISSGKVIGLSKMNRIVEYYGRRPQVQERMTIQIFNELKAALQTDDVIVVVEAEHLCVSSRGVNDKSSKTTTLEYAGKFNDDHIRNDFFKML